MRSRTLPPSVACLLVLHAAAIACTGEIKPSGSGDASANDGAAGLRGSGGGSSTGGASAGGAPSSGGRSGSGGVPAASGGRASSGGAAGAASGGSGGSGLPEAGGPRTYPTDRSAFGLGGGSRCANADVLLCEDFEGDAIDTGTWSLETWGSGSATIDSTRAARGKHSVHIQEPADISRVALRETKTFAKTGNHFFGRVFLYLDFTEDPLDCHTGTCTNLVHWTAVTAGGTYVENDQTYHPTVRSVGAVNQNLLTNLDGGPKAEVGVSDDGSVQGYEGVDASHANQWMCFEFEYQGEGDTAEVRVYWDGIDHPGLHYSTSHRGDAGELWPIPKYEYLEFGFEHYQNYSSFTPSFNAWLDEIAVDDERIGCEL